MRKIAVITAAALALASPALAGPKDQIKHSMIGPQALNGNATVDNTTTAAKWSVKGCKFSVQMKGVVGLSDGDIVICVADADVIAPPALPLPAGNGVVMLGEAKANQVKIKADVTEIGCGTQENVQYNHEVRCYLDDAAYRGGGWATACASVPMGAVPNASPDPDKLKVNDTENVIVGLCQGFLEGNRLPGPSSALIAQGGARGFIIPP